MIILNTNYELVNSYDDMTHQLSLTNIKGINESITIHGFSKNEVVQYFCKEKGFRIIPKGMININTDTWAFHITKEEDENIYIIFDEYLHIHFKEKNESQISLKYPIKIIESKENINSYKDTLKYFCIPKDTQFWIKEYSGEFGKELACHYWDTKELKNMGNMDMQEINVSDKILKNIIAIKSDKNLFITDDTCNINMFLKTYPNMFFKFLYEDFMDNIEEKYENFQRVIIVDIDNNSDIEKQILKKAASQLPFYICIPVCNYSSYYAVYEGFRINKD